VLPQVRRSADNAMGFAHDELTKQVRHEIGWPAVLHFAFHLTHLASPLASQSAPQSHPMLISWCSFIKQVRDLKEVFDLCRTPRPDLPDDHPANRTIDGYNRWPQGQVRRPTAERWQQLRNLAGWLAGRPAGCPPSAARRAPCLVDCNRHPLLALFTA
jgi:hypothetical protein